MVKINRILPGFYSVPVDAKVFFLDAGPFDVVQPEQIEKYNEKYKLGGEVWVGGDHGNSGSILLAQKPLPFDGVWTCSVPGSHMYCSAVIRHRDLNKIIFVAAKQTELLHQESSEVVAKTLNNGESWGYEHV